MHLPYRLHIISLADTRMPMQLVTTVNFGRLPKSHSPLFCYGSVPVRSRVVLRSDSKPVRTPANQIVSGAGGRSNGQCAVLAVAWISQAVSSLCKSYAKVWCSRWQNARSAQEKPSSRRYSAPRPAKKGVGVIPREIVGILTLALQGFGCTFKRSNQNSKGADPGPPIYRARCDGWTPE
jgi:hypothetical protein